MINNNEATGSSNGFEVDLENVDNVVIMQQNPHHDRNYKKLGAIIAGGVLAIVLIVAVAVPVSGNKSGSSSESSSTFSCAGDSAGGRQSADGNLYLTFEGLPKEMSNDQEHFVEDAIANAYNDNAGCDERFERHIEDVTFTDQALVTMEDGSVVLETELSAKVSYTCTDSDCPDLQEPIFSGGPPQDGGGSVRRRGLMKDASINKDNVLEALEAHLKNVFPNAAMRRSL